MTGTAPLTATGRTAPTAAPTATPTADPTATAPLVLVSHHLCPYVQRAAIALAEKSVAFERRMIDLANKPDWFRALSPLGKVPLLIVGKDGEARTIFESSVILEYLEETQPVPLHAADPLVRARERGWMEFGSTILNRISTFYNAATEDDLQQAADALAAMFGRLEAELGDGPWFAGERFSLVDAVFGPVFRYFDVIDRIDDFGILGGYPRVARWRRELSRRPSVVKAVDADYPRRLVSFLAGRGGALARRLDGAPPLRAAS